MNGSLSAAFLLHFGMYHVVFSVGLWVAFRQFVVYYLYRAGRLDENSYDFQQLDGRKWWTNGQTFTILGNAYLLLCSLGYFTFGLAYLGSHMRAPIHIGFTPDVLNWPNPLYVLGGAVLFLLAGTTLTLMNKSRLGWYVGLASALPLLALFFYAIPLS